MPKSAVIVIFCAVVYFDLVSFPEVSHSSHTDECKHAGREDRCL
jgi:hypothetical protein